MKYFEYFTLDHSAFWDSALAFKFTQIKCEIYVNKVRWCFNGWSDVNNVNLYAELATQEYHKFNMNIGPVSVVIYEWEPQNEVHATIMRRHKNEHFFICGIRNGIVAKQHGINFITF